MLLGREADHDAISREGSWDVPGMSSRESYLWLPVGFLPRDAQ